MSAVRRIYAVCLRELSMLLSSAAAWVFLVIFLVLSAFLTFLVSNILELGQAELTPFFNWMPWLFLFVLPALAMPLWSEERRTGTLELSLSYPVSIFELVAGKFLAGWKLLFFALLLTIGTPLTVAAFGEPDVNSILCGYLGAFLTGGVFLAVSCFCSALTRSQTASFLLSLTFCSLLMLTGWDQVAGYLALHLPPSVCRAIASFAILPHYQAFQRGLIDTSELAYLFLTIGLFLYLTCAALKFSASGTGGLFLPGVMRDAYTWKRLGSLCSGIAAALYIYCCLIYAAGVAPVRFDATADKAYSLTEQSKKIAASLERPVSVRLYLSPENSGMPRPLLLYGERVKWLLSDFAAASEGKLTLTLIRPEQDSLEEEAAQMDGLEPVQTPTGERFYLGIAVSCGDKVAPVRDLSPEREELLEYELVRAILRVSRHRKPRLGVLSSFPVLGKEPDRIAGTTGVQMLTFARELANDWELTEIPLNATRIPDDVSALLVFHPAGIHSRTLYALDQYLMRGGKMAVFLDPRLTILRENGRRDKDMRSIQKSLERKQSDLGPLTAAWGIDYRKDQVTADMNFKYTPAARPGAVRSVQPDVLLVTPDGICKDRPETAALTSLFLSYPGAFLVTDPRKGLIYETLVHTTRHAKLHPAELNPAEVFAQFAADPNAENGKELPLVLRISGIFRTAYPGGTPDAASLDAGKKHLDISSGHPEVVLFADSDMLFRQAFLTTVNDSSGQPLAVKWNDNLPLLQNVLERLCGSESLSHLRTRKPMSRPLTKIAESRGKVELKYAERYLALRRDFERKKHYADAIRRKLVAGGGKLRLTPEEREFLSRFSLTESEFRREEKAIRLRLKEGLESVNTIARLVNLLLIPAFTALLGIIWGILLRVSRRRKRS